MAPLDSDMKAAHPRLTTDAVIETLSVRIIFTIPPIPDAPSSERLFVAPSPEAAVIMAMAAARLSGDPGAVLIPVESLPAAEGAFAEAAASEIPLLVITPGGADPADGDGLGIKATVAIRPEDDLPAKIVAACRIATAHPAGPVRIRFPASEAESMVDVIPDPPSPLDPAVPAAAAAGLIEAASPGLLLGPGCRGHGARCIQVAEALDAPVATSLAAIDVFPADHPLHVGLSEGPDGVPAARRALYRCDCLLTVGLDSGAALPSRAVHRIIAAPRGNMPPAADTDLILPGDPGVILDALLFELAGTARPSGRPESADRERIARDKALYRRAWLARRGRGVNPAQLFDVLTKAVAPRAVIVADPGEPAHLVAELLPMIGDRAFLTPSRSTEPGYAVAAAVGCWICHPDRTTIAVVEAAGLLAGGPALTTAVARQAGGIIIVLRQRMGAKPGAPAPSAGVPGAFALEIPGDPEVKLVIPAALALARRGIPVIVGVSVDRARRSRYSMNRTRRGRGLRTLGRRLLNRLWGHGR